MCSPRWRATTPACAGPRSRSTTADDAKDALDRITIPQDVLDRIAPTALPRSSIVISDEPLSNETNYRTEFVAVLSNQPQGGFITRQPTVDVIMASGDRNDGFSFGFFNFPREPPATGQYAAARRPASPSGATGLLVRSGVSRAIGVTPRRKTQSPRKWQFERTGIRCYS